RTRTRASGRLPRTRRPPAPPPSAPPSAGSPARRRCSLRPRSGAGARRRRRTPRACAEAVPPPTRTRRLRRSPPPGPRPRASSLEPLRRPTGVGCRGGQHRSRWPPGRRRRRDLLEGDVEDRVRRPIPVVEVPPLPVVDAEALGLHRVTQHLAVPPLE